MRKREIKFRGKHIITGKWFYGYLLSKNIIGKVEIIKGRVTLTEYCIVDPKTIGQYTGLKDKNGNENKEI